MKRCPCCGVLMPDDDQLMCDVCLEEYEGNVPDMMKEADHERV